MDKKKSIYWKKKIFFCCNEIDCYRKKQRGDCNGLDFQRASKERAQYVHNPQHPDQPPPTPNPQPPVQHELSRNPSWTLRQLELRLLSHRTSDIKDQKVYNIKPKTLSTHL